MLIFPNCKVNLGLHVVNKRPDGYHNIETVFYPMRWSDAIEVLEGGDSDAPFSLEQSGTVVEGPIEQNLIFKAWQMVSQHTTLPPIRVHLHKNIPMGAGLGGGSSDAACFINTLNRKFHLDLDLETRTKMAAGLGSDCPFFIKNKPVLATGKGELFSDIQVDLSRYYLLAVYPGLISNTKEAYEGLVPAKPSYDLKTVLEKEPLSAWKGHLVNDFEPVLFKKYPKIRHLKETLYAGGAMYASMSGSGSAVFGIFEKAPELNFPTTYTYCLQKPGGEIL